MKFKIMVPRFWTSDSSTVIVLALSNTSLSNVSLCVQDVSNNHQVHCEPQSACYLNTRQI